MANPSSPELLPPPDYGLRGPGLTFFCVFQSVISVITFGSVLRNFRSPGAQVTPGELRYVVGISLAMLIPVVGVWLMRRWAVAVLGALMFVQIALVFIKHWGVCPSVLTMTFFFFALSNLKKMR